MIFLLKQNLRAMSVVGIIEYIFYCSSLFAQGRPDTLWTKIYGGISEDYGYSVQQTNDNGYIITGSTKSFGADGFDVWLIKTDENGDTLWTKTYGGTGYDYGLSVHQTTDNGYIIAGGTSSFGAGIIDFYLIKTDENGDTLWTKTYGGTDYDYGRAMQQTTDGGYIITGNTWSFGAGASDVYLVKTDENGDTLWTKTYGGISEDYGFSVQQTTDNGYIITGYTMSFGTAYSYVYLIKTDENGDTLWTKTYGVGAGNYGYSVQQTTDNGYIIAGHTWLYEAWASLVYLVKTDENGDTLWTETYGGTGDDRSNSVQQTTDNGYIIVGYTNSFGAGDYDVYFIKIMGTDYFNETGSNLTPGIYDLSQNYPNPFKTETGIHYQLPKSGAVTIVIYNVSGQCTKTLVNGYKDAGYYTVRWNGRGQDGQIVSNGVYFCQMVAGAYTTVKKILLTR
jgi:hypothetical protein